jgi:hypothetical protein
MLPLRLLFTVLIASTFHGEALAYSNQWFRCQKPADCVKTEATCSRARAVNRSFQAAYDAFVAKSKTQVKCTAPSKTLLAIDKASIPACVKNQCVLNQPPLQPVKKSPPKKAATRMKGPQPLKASHR